VLSCGGGEPAKSGTIAPTPTGSIEGTVQLSGEELPEATHVANTTDPEVCGRGHTLEDLVLSPETRGVRYAIAALGDVPSEAIPRFEPDLVVMDNVDCRFEPHAVAVTLGSTLEALNSDPVLHTTHLYGPADVNISLPVKGARSRRTLHQEGIYVVKCDVHGWMQAFVRVDPHPFHAVSDENGSFRIAGIPAGRYVLEVWHETLGSQETEVLVEDGATASVRIEYPLPEN
jgi:plastocyanin